ncbi:SubName: Full=Uncharacterized protein {ECO:0000313/EMBL:CCA76143.1} [Serendipita indica DSM 11827]|nr:SubName: Full=Uncharacterized protein {ECO:0000313/EMBL:CCA76143.1} [Serendipita indica DSM 11827]
MNGIRDVALTYDIACQYSRNFQRRFDSLAAFLRLPPHLRIIFLVPKFHLPAHKEACRYQYSLNFCKNVGRTDGEAIERFWSAHNYLSGSTMRTSPCSRQDALNFHFNYWNWRKTRKMGKTLLKRLQNAREMLVQHTILLADLRDSVGVEKSTVWSQLEDNYMIRQGEHTIYQTLADRAPTRLQVLQRLTQFNNDLQPLGAEDDNRPAMVLWINDGLEIEEQQARLIVLIQSTIGGTERQLVELNRKRANLSERINAWKARAPDNGQDDGDDEPTHNPELQRLMLPSQLPYHDQNEELRRIEKELREAQAFDYLRALRTSLAEKIALVRDKETNQRGNQANARARSVIDRVQMRIDFEASRYRVSFSALQRLGGVDNVELMPLAPQDVSIANVFRFTCDLERGYNTSTSWIWRRHAVGEQAMDNDWLNEFLRVRFLEAKVNHDRWKEECELVRVELGYTYRSFRHWQWEWIQKAQHSQVAGEVAHSHLMSHLYAMLAHEVGEIIVQVDHGGA